MTAMNRRTLVKAGAAAIAAPALLRVIPANAQSRVIKIGHVSPRTGPIAAFGEADEFVVNGVRNALKDGLTINGVKHPVQIIVKDSQSNPSRAESSLLASR